MTTSTLTNGDFNNGSHSNGNGINKRGGSKKGGKGKKSKSKGNGNHSKGEQHSDENHSSARGHRRNVISGTKHIHDNDDDESSLQKKLRSSKLSTSLSSASPRWKFQDWMRYLILHTLALFITVPLLLSSGGILGCGGRAKFNHLVNIVLLKQRQRQQQLDSSTSGNAGFSLTELMEHMSTTFWQNFNNAQHFRNNNRWIKRKYDDTNDLQNISISNDTDLHESMCHVTAIAIGQFSFHLPYAQWLVLRKESSSATLFSSNTVMLDDNKRSTQLLDNDSSNSKMETLSVHKLDNKMSVSSSLVDGRRRHPIIRVIAIFLNPIRRILQKASIYSHHRKQTRMKNREEKENSKTSNNGIVGGITLDVEWKKWKYAMTDDYELTPNEIQLVKELAGRVITHSYAQCPPGDDVNNNNNKTISCKETEMSIPSQSGGSDIPNRPFQERVDIVSWGGIHNNDDTRWWPHVSNTDPSTMISANVDGGRLLAAYLKIMKWDSIYPKFPFRLCPKGCNPEVALLHTLEWREKYKPWCVSNEMINFNTAGFIYTRGHSNPGIIQRRYMTEIAQSNAGHSMVWYRPSLASPSVNTELYMRTIIHTLDLAVSNSLIRNGGTIGRFNLVMDFAGMSSKNSPTIANVKRLFSVLQDHFPDRLGVLLVANSSSLTQMLMKMMLPFVTEDVRAKIHIIPNKVDERRDMLLQSMTEDQIPNYLGGKDEYNYDAIQYYQGKCVLPENSITEYISTMPFHA